MDEDCKDSGFLVQGKEARGIQLANLLMNTGGGRQEIIQLNSGVERMNIFQFLYPILEIF